MFFFLYQFTKLFISNVQITLLNCVSLKDILNHFNRVNPTSFVTRKYKTQTEHKIPPLCLFLLILCSQLVYIKLKKQTKTTVHKIYIPLTVQHGFCLLSYFFFFFLQSGSVCSYREHVFNWGGLICLTAYCIDDHDGIICKKERKKAEVSL